MRSVTIVAHVPGRSAPQTFGLLRDFSAYPRYSKAVRSVTVTEVAGNATISRWEVSFRTGILRWTEEDIFDSDGLHIAFRQLEGDIALLEGTWHCEPVGDSSKVTFTATFDLGIPTLSAVLEPIAARALIDNTASILRGLFGPQTQVESAAGAALPAGAV